MWAPGTWATGVWVDGLWAGETEIPLAPAGPGWIELVLQYQSVAVESIIAPATVEMTQVLLPAVTVELVQERPQ